MTKPTPLRKKDILDKLAYSMQRYQELMNVLFEAKRESKDPAFLVHACADIVSNVRECFDYLAQDIVECHIIPFTSNNKLKQAHAAGKLKVYFPYYEAQLKRSDSPFFDLNTTNAPLYQSLLHFTQSIAINAVIPKTSFSYSLFLDVKDMVNKKKHDKLIAVVSEADREYLIENGSMKMLLPLSGQSGWSNFFVEPGTMVQKAAEYRFSFNEQEVGKFCLFATKATELVIGDLYQAYFA